MAKNKRFTGAPGPSDISTWNKQIIPQQTIVSSQPTTGGFLEAAGGSVGVNQSAKALFDMSPEERKVIAQALKNVGYKGFPVNGAYSSALANAYTSALQAAQFDASQLGQTFSDSYFTNFLARETEAFDAMGRDGGPRTTEQISVITDRAARDIIDAVISDQLGRKATKDEIERYTRTAQRKASKQPTVTTSIPLGGGRTRLETQPGFGQTDFSSFLVDKIAGTDEAKANKVLSYYETAMKVLAGE